MSSLSGRKYTSQYKGVSWHKASRSWIVQLKKDRHCRYRGYFAIEVDAARAYDEAAWQLYGPQAFLNFPERFEGRKAA